MGKLHSKHAAVCKRRESPEGDSFAVNASWARKGIEDWIGKQRYPVGTSGLRQPQGGDSFSCGTQDPSGEGYSEDHFRLEVALPPEKADVPGSGEEKKREMESEAGSGPKKQLKFEELQCDVSVEEGNRQEWTFTLYDFDNNGKVTREDITSLLHTIYEVVDSSVNHSPSSSKTLRVKLTVAPDGSQKKKSFLLNPSDLQSARHRTESRANKEPRSGEKKQRASLRAQGDSHLETSDCNRHCVDENIERRNHYLDLAGIENYTSKFGPGPPLVAPKCDPPSRGCLPTRSRSQEPEALYGPHRQSQGPEPGLFHLLDASYAKIAEVHQRLWSNQEAVKHFGRSPKVQGKTVGSGPPGRVARSKQSPGVAVPAASPSARLAPAPAYLPNLAPKKHKQRGKESQQMCRSFQPPRGPLAEKEHARDLATVLLYEGQVGQMVQRHEHHHHHDHHHHYHHFYQT
ncbi:protein naked cuticle homolog 1 [Tachyglossus aculeatus]|uniref:protein naked cuticle homolog 1 n=1 Tax=Tachyglossus aculeatus TaxID=9261 RepID=UPI0018F297FA|nr:protein naked cuticle homolog 1 [Tachyglossus aculeatus]